MRVRSLRKVGLVMRKIQFTEAQGPRVFADRLKQIGLELGVDIVFISPGVMSADTTGCRVMSMRKVTW